MRPFGPDRPPEQCETLIGGTCFARWEWYRVLADSETFGTPTPEPDASAESVGCFR